MAETSGKFVSEVMVPETVDSEWLDQFNELYADKGWAATVTTEDWLEQPPNEIGSGYYDLVDEMGHEGWWQTISGNVVNAGYTNVPDYHDTVNAHVLALSDARLQLPDGNSRTLADGRLVLIRLDRLKNNPLISASE